MSLRNWRTSRDPLSCAASSTAMCARCKASGRRTQIEISQPVRRTRTLLRLEKLEYNVPLDESTFTVEALTPGPWPPAPGPQP